MLCHNLCPDFDRLLGEANTPENRWEIVDWLRIKLREAGFGDAEDNWNHMGSVGPVVVRLFSHCEPGIWFGTRGEEAVALVTSSRIGLPIHVKAPTQDQLDTLVLLLAETIEQTSTTIKARNPNTVGVWAN
ncbi:MAG: hypothetical protein Q8P13_03145 [bacterium]|nr:hypothetical protein [bacterium]